MSLYEDFTAGDGRHDSSMSSHGLRGDCDRRIVFVSFLDRDEFYTLNYSAAEHGCLECSTRAKAYHYRAIAFCIYDTNTTIGIRFVRR